MKHTIKANAFIAKLKLLMVQVVQKLSSAVRGQQRASFMERENI